MSVIWMEDGIYRSVAYKSEADLEKAIIQVQNALFGANRIYLDVKKKIGRKGGQRNIPDGYLIDISGYTPRLYVVENELAAHHPIRHVAVQLLEFSLSFESEPRGIAQILFDALKAQPEAKAQCESYVASHEQFRNLDHLLDTLVYDSPFAALVVIDEIPDELQTVLDKRFKFGVEILELTRYENGQGKRIYRFEPFLADIEDAVEGVSKPVDMGELDTIVVPAREDGFQETFLGKDCWYAIRIHGTMRPQIKYIAAYRIRPISAITHIAPVHSIEPWKETGKYIVKFAEPAQEIDPIRLVKKGRVRALQNIRYTSIDRLRTAKTMDDVW